MVELKAAKRFTVEVINGNDMLESHMSKNTGRIALGFEVEGTPSVREPDVLDVVNKPPHEMRGSLKHSPGRHIRLASCTSTPKAYFSFTAGTPNLCVKATGSG